MNIQLSENIPEINKGSEYEKVFKFSNKMCVIHKMIQIDINASTDWSIVTNTINYEYPVSFLSAPCVLVQVNDNSGESTFIASVGVKRDINLIENISFLRHKATKSKCWISILIIGMLK